MHIQWFPGHMTKALRMMKENETLVDCFVYVLDARAPYACINPTFDSVIGTKPVLYIINKADMITESDKIRIGEQFKKEGKFFVFSNSKNGGDAKQLINAIKQLAADKVRKYREKNAFIPVRAMVIGIPNTGKSTFINCVCGGKRTITGNRPGVTKGKQWVVLSDGVELLDTPGTLCPSFSDQEKAMHLAFLGSINDVILDMQELARELVKYLAVNHTEKLCARYKLTPPLDNDPDVILEQIAYKRGVIVKGGEIDYDRLYTVVIDDFRKQRIGAIALE